MPTNQQVIILTNQHIYSKYLIDLSGDKNLASAPSLSDLSCSLISANKQFLSNKLSYVNAYHNNQDIRYDASVGGGIPIITALRALSFVKLISARLVINGTTNYILSNLLHGKCINDILHLSLKKGYAEKNISYDLMGYDIKHKTDILLKTIGIAPADIIPEKLILNKTFIHFFNLVGFSIKYFSIVHTLSGSVEIIIAGCITRNIVLYASGIYNYIEIKIKNIGKLLFFGLGAGAKPTSLSIVSDMLTHPFKANPIIPYPSIRNIIRFVGIFFYHKPYPINHNITLFQPFLKKIYVYKRTLFFLTNRISNGRFLYIRRLFLLKNILSTRMV
ncbi:hypothetical protein [Candidatus Vidania fulgoroideorum]